MAQKLDFNLPFNDLRQYVPKNLRNSVISGLLDNLFNRFMTRDESVPLYGYVGRKPSSIEDTSPRVPQLNAERDINAVTPVLNFKVGTERVAFTVQDIIKKAESVGISTESLNWLYSQGNNFLPPVDFDKFTNFYDYYWVAKALDSIPPMEWNPELLPEYYVIARPKPTDLVKLNARVSSSAVQQYVLTGSGFYDQFFTLNFIDGDTFDLTPSAALIGPLGVWAVSNPVANPSDYAGTTAPISVTGDVLRFNLPTLPSVPQANPVDVEATFRYVVRRSGFAPVTLVEFKITREPTFNSSNVHNGYTTYVTGDVATIDTTFLQSTYALGFSGSPGLKPKISGVKALNEYQTIDSVQLREGDRVLIQGPGSVSGIYVVSAGTWQRAEDFTIGTWAVNAEVYVTDGPVNGGKLWRSGGGVGAWTWTNVGTVSNTTDWQEGNFWVSSAELETLGLDRASVVQATRPIIEYSTGLQLNSRVVAGIPQDGTPNYRQEKTEFNQLPLFDLFRYDGIHSGLVTSIFYYVEDLTADLDIALQRRVKRSSNDSSDFLFNHGCVDSEGSLLFFKQNGELKTVWHAGYYEPTVVDISQFNVLVEAPGTRVFTGTGTGVLSAVIGGDGLAQPQTVTITFTSPISPGGPMGFTVAGSVDGQVGTGVVGQPFISSLVNFAISSGVTTFTTGSTFVFDLVNPGSISSFTASDATHQQVWTLTAISGTTFEVKGSKLAILPPPYDIATVDVPYDNGDVSFTINSGVAPFTVGDSFVVRVGNFERPRYVFRDPETENIYDLFGGPANDLDKKGAWSIPLPYIYNPYNDSRSELVEGSVYSHMRSIIANQIDGQPTDFAFGGNIKLWSEQQTLLAALLMQKDMTPVSMIDMALRQYEAGLNAIRDIYIQRIVDYFSTASVVSSDGTAAETAKVNQLLDAILEIRRLDQDVRTVLFDTTASVIGFPATLPQLGIAALVAPHYEFDPVLGRTVLVHHDGHFSIPYVDDAAFRQEILGNYVGKTVLRSDGTETPAIGSFTSTPPSVPYKGELWVEPDTTMWAYDVNFDTSLAPAIQPVGSTWFQRSSGVLYLSDGLTWLPQPDHTVRWKQVDLAANLNELLLLTETRLHNGINHERRLYDFSAIETNLIYVQQLQRELFTFAAVNGLDPLATNYNAQDAFTWNYSDATVFAPVTTPSVPARWYNALMAHQQTVAGVIPTERPNLEPWKLFGFSSFSLWWASLSGAAQAAYTPFAAEVDGTFINGGSVRAVKTTVGVTALTGLQIVDGVSLQNGDRVLLVGESNPINNGVWTVSSGAWTRPAVPLTLKTYFTVNEGTTRAGTTWAVTATATAGVTPVSISQVRQWTEALWAAVAAARPLLKTSVNPYNDDLLPPYVASSSAVASYALTNTIPPGIALPFEFGEGSPVEEVWSRSIEYGYAQAKALFRFDPLAFLGFCWGFNWVEVDGILYDGFDLQMPGHQRFRLHGDTIAPVTGRMGIFNVASITGTGPIDITVTYDAYDDYRRQNFSVRGADGTIIQNVHPEAITNNTQNLVENLSANFSGGGITMTAGDVFIQDSGRPFRVGDKWHITANADGSNLSIEFIPATYHQILGFGQTFTNALRSVSIDTTNSYAISAFREWDVNMGYRAGGLVATDDLKVLTEFDTLNEASYQLMFKKNEGSRSLWLQGLRCTVFQYGTQAVYNGFVQNYPSGDASDWVFRIEGYNPRYLDVSYYVYPSTTARQTFYALDRSATALAWTQPLEPSGVQTAQLPLTITGLQNVIDFLFGYAQYSKDQGWEFSATDEKNVDAETGRHRDWQLEVEKLVDRVYRGIELSQGHIVNPFIDQVQVRQDTGLLGQFSDAPLFDVYSHAAVYDLTGAKLQTSDIFVERGNLKSTYSAQVPMFSMHALIDEYEHLFIFNNFINGSDASGLLYDPFSGSRVVTYKFNGRRSNTGTLRPEFGGYYMAGDQVRLNLQAGVDGVGQYYDANSVFENQLTSSHALALLGFSKKDYFTSLDITDKSQFNFWRGLIQSKGTNMSIGAYLNNNRFKDAKVDEFWAYKVAEYGDARQKTFPELRLQVADCLQQFTALQFDVDTTLQTPLPNFTQITRFDEDRWFSIDDLNQDTYFKAEAIGAYSRTFGTLDAEGNPITYPFQVVLDFAADRLVITGPATQLNATTLMVSTPGTVTVTGYGPATPRYNPVKLFNYEDNELVEEIPLWHPAIKQHTPIALESINTISDINPARYNYSTLVVNNNSYDPLRPWGDREVGRVWFDTRNLSYVPYYDPYIFPNRAERLSRWGALADFSTIDVYEWVKSSVPPTEYDALALIDAGNADIDASVKASGKVALQETYSRDRIWKIKPIAWSYSNVPIDIDWGEFPPMKLTADITAGQLYISGQNVVLLSGTFAQFGAVAGDRIGTWQHGVNRKPLTEGVINDTFSQFVASASAAGNVSLGTQTSGNYSVTLNAVSYTDDRLLGQVLVSHNSVTDVEKIQIFDIDGLGTDQWDHNYYVTIADDIKSERILAYTVRATGTSVAPPASPTMTVTAGQQFTYSFPISGLSISVTANAGGTVAAGSIAAAIDAALDNKADLRDAVTVTWTISPPTGTYSNDPEEAINIGNPDYIGWRVWEVPTQDQLDADGRYPVSSWKPYVGDAVQFAPTYEQLEEAVAYVGAPLTLNDGTVVERYDNSWTEWSKLEDVKKTSIAITTGPMEFNSTDFGVTRFDANSTSVYVNGIAQLKAAYTISGDILTVLNVQQGFIVTVIVRRYEPTTAELEFDPAVEDDLTFQRQYKKDYEYVSLVTRDSVGNFDTTYYYFWVRNKTTQAAGKKLSVQAITQLLRDGPPNYLTFQNLLEPVTTPVPMPWRYDAITIAGLSYVVAKDDTFKLRFTRNFTLRDDPNDLDLKDVHTEWSLMRPAQKTKIPERLWLKLVESAAGEDLAGNPVPSLRRVLYDERNGTQTQFGFDAEQTLAPAGLLRSSLSDIIVNTRLEEETPTGTVPDYIEFIDLELDLRSTDAYDNPVEKRAAKAAKAVEVQETFLSTPELVRTTMTSIWTTATVAQINEVFFAALEDILASNFEMTDIFKTSRLSLYSIQEKRAGVVQPTYE